MAWIRARRSFMVAVGVFAVLTGGAFLAAAIDRGPEGVLWAAGMETGDLSEWSGFTRTGQAQAQLTLNHSRSGQYSLALRANASAGVAGIRARSEDRIYAADPHNLPPDAYYSVWIYVPQPLNPVNNIFQWKQAVLNDTDHPNEGQTRRLLYFIRADWVPEDQNMKLVLRGKVNPEDGSWPNPAGNYTLAESVDLRLELDTWHYLEARYVWDAGGQGLVEVWLDGVKWAGVDGLYTELTASYLAKPRQWTVNNYMTEGTGSWQPEVTVIYVDDAAISTYRLSG